MSLTCAWARSMLDSVDDMSAVEDFLPYRGRWELAEVRRYFARPPVPLSVSLLTERGDGILHRREVNFAAGSGVRGIATVVSPLSKTVTRGVVLAHGGSDDGRRFFVSEAAALAAQGCGGHLAGHAVPAGRRCRRVRHRCQERGAD
jgi:hypothetical protein